MLYQTFDKDFRRYYNIDGNPTKAVGIKLQSARGGKSFPPCDHRSVMKISSKTHYGVQVLCLIAAKNQSLSAKELEKYTGVSSKYLEKVLKILLKAGALESRRGAGGGYTLARPASEIKMGEAVRALEEDNMEIIGCVNKTGCCCPSSALWKKLFDGINEVLDGVTLQDVVDGKV